MMIPSADPFRDSFSRLFLFTVVCTFTSWWNAIPLQTVQAGEIDFNRDIRPILSGKCLTCHGPDTKKREAGLRLDVREQATSQLESEETAVVPGKPEKSELINRVSTSDEFLRMPPAESGKPLSKQEVQLLTQWIQQGAPYAKHWSYVKPKQPLPPTVQQKDWPRNAIDAFILHRLEQEGLQPAPEAEKVTLIRRVALDLTGLPPTIEEVDSFLKDNSEEAYERMVDLYLKKPSFGEHWARKWLDLARYADSAGYADDPPRTIWAYRDWVIRAINNNLPFDQFTIEQLAGDLLPNPTQDQLVATAFHRNTLTNNEGGTNDEEFRNVAIVDRVNTTMAVWMGTTINCCQCHSHKYDPISQKEFYQLFAILNNSEDADRRNEAPLLEIWTPEQQQQKEDWNKQIKSLEQETQTLSPELKKSLSQWEKTFAREPKWNTLFPEQATARSKQKVITNENGTVFVPQSANQDITTLTFPLKGERNTTPDTSAKKSLFPSVTAIRLVTLPHEKLPGKGAGHANGNFTVTRILGALIPGESSQLKGQFVRVELPGNSKILSLAEVQVFQGSNNVALQGTASQSSTAFQGPAQLAIDGNTNGDYNNAKSTTHTNTEANPWWEVKLAEEQPVDHIIIWNRTDNNLHTRLNQFVVKVLDNNRKTVWEQKVNSSPNPNLKLSLSGVRSIKFVSSYADYSQNKRDASFVLDGKNSAKTGWSVGGKLTEQHQLVLIPESPIEWKPGDQLQLKIEQLSAQTNQTLGQFKIESTTNSQIHALAKIPTNIFSILQKKEAERSLSEQLEIGKYYLTIAPQLKQARNQLATLKKKLSGMKPATTVPVMKELPTDKRRITHIQLRGNFLNKGDLVTTGLPQAFHSLSEAEWNRCRNQEKTSNPNQLTHLDRLALARWLVDSNNPLTPRVIANRYWEVLFGSGIVQTSEEFGSQGSLPTHPQLLDWLAAELIRLKWNRKALLKTIVMSATYRQSSKVTPDSLEKDPGNLLHDRGPRFRISAEMVRDQALFVSGLLSSKMYGPPVKPPQPQLGVRAAFGSGIDWQTSKGEDRHRRALYTTWRRSNPYPSMAVFDAPNREVCILNRDRTNTPLQALVTLNDPVYVEAAQSLGRRMNSHSGELNEQARFGFRLCLAREPNEEELKRLTDLYRSALKKLSQDETAAKELATNPIGAIPADANMTELAAWTVVGNVLLNLDEMFLKR